MTYLGAFHLPSMVRLSLLEDFAGALQAARSVDPKSFTAWSLYGPSARLIYVNCMVSTPGAAPGCFPLVTAQKVTESDPAIG